MIRLAPLALVFWLSIPAMSAGEITVATRPFTLEKAAVGMVLPADGAVLLQVVPKSWQDFEIEELAAHGQKVAKGGVLVRFDAEAIDRKLEDTRRLLASDELKLAQADADLRNLIVTAPHRLEALRRAAEIAEEERQYFVKTSRKAQEEAATQALERSKQSLDNQQEELKQLSQMYAADDLTEETEEIILTRQKNAVESAEFALRMAKLEHQRTFEVGLPLEAEKLANQQRDAAIARTKGENDIPREIALKKIEAETLKTVLVRTKQTLADLEHDKTLFEIKAPADGWFYHGPITNGRWLPGEIVKTLVKHGKPPIKLAFATFVPANVPVMLTAFLDESAARSLKEGVAGTASLAGREDLDIPVKLTRLDLAPAADGSYRADFAAEWPEDAQPMVGATAQIRLIAYHQPEAIAIPSKSLSYGVDGWTAEVKLADGKSERRKVKRGRVSGDLTEILSGLEVGQVVLEATAAPAK